MAKKITTKENLTPLQRILQTVGLFRDNDVSSAEVSVAAFQLTVASADPNNQPTDLVHIENGIKRLGGIAVQRDGSFVENFIEALDKGEAYAAEQGGTAVPDVVEEVKKILRYDYAA